MSHQPLLLEHELYQIETRRGHCAGVFVDENWIIQKGSAPLFKSFVGQSFFKLIRWHQVIRVTHIDSR